MSKLSLPVLLCSTMGLSSGNQAEDAAGWQIKVLTISLKMGILSSTGIRNERPD